MTANAISVGAEELAAIFHETYERLAPGSAAAVPWEQMPEANRALRIAVANEVIGVLAGRAKGFGSPHDPDFGVDARDSAELLRLRDAVDSHLGWKVLEDEEKADYPARVREYATDVKQTIDGLMISLEWRRSRTVDLVLMCPGCGKQHLDVGEFETRVHRTHTCEHTPSGWDGCGHTWMPFAYATRGVPGKPEVDRLELVALLCGQHGYEAARSDSCDLLVRRLR